MKSLFYILPLLLFFFFPLPAQADCSQTYPCQTDDGQDGTSTCTAPLDVNNNCDYSKLSCGACQPNSPAVSPSSVPPEPTAIPTCRPITTPIPTVSLPPNQSSDQVVAPALDADINNVKAVNQGLLPESFHITPTLPPGQPTPTPPVTQIGVHKGFFIVSGLPQLLCQIVGLFCPTGLNIASGQIDSILITNSLVHSSQLPSELPTPTPPARDCFVSDQNLYSGNQKIDDLTSLCQTYLKDLPSLGSFDDLITAIKNKDNLSLGGKVFNADQRVPLIEACRKIYYQSIFPRFVTLTPTP